MSLATNISDLATAVGTELKSHKVLINGNAADLSALQVSAPNKINLVAAINEVASSAASATGIDDSTTTNSSTWSSSKIDDSITDTRTAIEAELPVLTDLINDSAASTSTVYSSTQTNTAISAATTALINDTAAAATTVYSSSMVDSQIAATKDEILGGADAAFDTLRELEDALSGDTSGIADLTTALGNRVRFDAAQSLTTGADGQQAQARANIGAAGADDLGDVSSLDLVGTFTSALAS